MGANFRAVKHNTLRREVVNFATSKKLNFRLRNFIFYRELRRYLASFESGTLTRLLIRGSLVRVQQGVLRENRVVTLLQVGF